MSRYLIVSIGIFVAFSLALVLLYYSIPMNVKVRSFNEAFTQIELGTTEKETLRILGEPDARETLFRLGRTDGFEPAYTRAAASSAKQYLLWFRSVDVIFSIGIDDQGVVVIKESGST